MRTNFTTIQKDNVASATLLAATLIAIMGSMVTSSDARADKAMQMEVQKMETIIITAPRIQQVSRLETIVVTASRLPDVAPSFMVASK